MVQFVGVMDIFDWMGSNFKDIRLLILHFCYGVLTFHSIVVGRVAGAVIVYDPLVGGSWNRVLIGFRFCGLLLPLIFVTGAGSICHMTWMGDHIMIGCFMSFHSLWFVSSFEILESSLKDISQ